jgi:hypothetical protein
MAAILLVVSVATISMGLRAHANQPSPIAHRRHMHHADAFQKCIETVAATISSGA